MDENNKLTDEIKPVSKQGSGSMLAAARKRQNRTVEEIADELNLSVTQIRTIELDQSEGLPEPTYVRGYIRSYARLVGLDADRVLDHYLNPNWQRGTRLDDMPRGIGSANEREASRFLTPGKLATIIVLLATAGFLWYSGLLGSMFAEDEVASNPSSAATPSQPSTTPTSSGPDSDTIEQQDQLGQADNDAIGASADADSSEPTQAEAGGDPADNENVLSLAFTDTSWVDIRDASGERLAYKSYAQGEDLTVTAATPMSVFIGNAKAVSATLNGEAYDISQFREGVFARFTVGE